MKNFLAMLKPKEWYGVLVGTLLVMLVNYVAYYADDWLIVTQGAQAAPLLIEAFRAISFPVHLYIELVEKNFWIPIPVLGRAINYCIESAYFLSFTLPLYLLCRKLARSANPTTPTSPTASH